MTFAWRHRSVIVGIPSGRSLPLAFGMYTRLAGLALPGLVGGQMFHQFPLAAGVLTTSLSTPAVFLPAFTCVTLRTLKSVLDVASQHEFLERANFLPVARLCCPKDTLSQVTDLPIDFAPVDA